MFYRLSLAFSSLRKTSIYLFVISFIAFISDFALVFSIRSVINILSGFLKYILIAFSLSSFSLFYRLFGRGVGFLGLLSLGVAYDVFFLAIVV